MDILESKIVKIRKEQICWGCEEKFEKGSKLLFVKGVSADDFNSCYWCQVCDKTISDNIGSYLDYESDGYEYGVVKEFANWEENKSKYTKIFRL